MSRSERVAIIGGGVAGLAAAFALREQGAAVVLYEALPHLGGRAAGGAAFDTGRHLASSSYHSLLRLLDRLGSREKLQMPPLALGVLDARRTRFWQLGSPLLTGTLGAAISLVHSPLLPLRARLSSLVALNRILHEDTEEPSDEELLGDGTDGFLHSQALTVAELMKRDRWPQALQDHFGIPVALGMFNALPDAAAGSAFVNAIKRVIHDQDRRAGWVRGDAGSIITQPAQTCLAAEGVEVRTGTRVLELNATYSGWEIVTKVDRDEAQAVLLTLPPNHLTKLKGSIAEHPLVRTAAEINGNGIVTLRAHFAHGETLPGPLAEAASPYGVWFSEPHPDGGTMVERVISGIPISETPDLEGLLATFLRDASRRLNCSGLNDSHTRYYPFATPALTPQSPRPVVHQGRGLYYAGDWSATGLPATMESAARAGELAGNAMAMAMRKST